MPETVAGFLIPQIAFQVTPPERYEDGDPRRRYLEVLLPQTCMPLPSTLCRGELTLQHVEVRRSPLTDGDDTYATLMLMVVDGTREVTREGAQQVADALLGVLATADRVEWEPREFLVLAVPKSLMNSEVLDLNTLEKKYPYELDPDSPNRMAVRSALSGWCRFTENWDSIHAAIKVLCVSDTLRRAAMYLAESKRLVAFQGDDVGEVLEDVDEVPLTLAGEVAVESAFWLVHKCVETVLGGRLPNELSGLKGKLAKKGIPDFVWGWEPSDTMNASELIHQYRERRDGGAAHGGRRTEVIRFFEVMDYQRFATNLLLETMNVEATTHGLPLPFAD